jgi:hypothetical protein
VIGEGQLKFRGDGEAVSRHPGGFSESEYVDIEWGMEICYVNPLLF